MINIPRLQKIATIMTWKGNWKVQQMTKRKMELPQIVSNDNGQSSSEVDFKNQCTKFKNS